MRNIVLLSTAEWDNPFWTNKQHTACSLSRLDCRILYVESLGLRRPTAHARDWLRIIKRLIKAFSLPRQVKPNLWVWSPLVVPSASKWYTQLLNRIVFTISLRSITLLLGFRKSILWTYNPLVRRYINLKYFSAIIYHCVDNISAQPGMDSRLIKTEERKLCEAADHVFVTSPMLYKSLSEWTKCLTYLPNVVDFNHFSTALTNNLPVPKEYIDVPKPRLLFVGAISSYKVDFDLIREVALIMPSCSIVLVGLVGEGDPVTDVKKIKNIPNIHLLGPKPYRDLPMYMAHSQVGLLPCLLNKYTEAMFPMKFFEYLAAGLPVVSTQLPALDKFQNCFLSGENSSEFIVSIKDALDGRSAIDPNYVSSIASKYTYEDRTIAMLKILDQVLGNISGKSDY